MCAHIAFLTAINSARVLFTLPNEHISTSNSICDNIAVCVNLRSHESLYMTISAHWCANFTPFKALIAVFNAFAVSGAAVISVATVVASLISGISSGFLAISLIGIVQFIEDTFGTSGFRRPIAGHTVTAA